VGQMGKVKRESTEPLGTGLALLQNQSELQWSGVESFSQVQVGLFFSVYIQ